MEWKAAAFRYLSPAELYAALQLREAVFALEQNCLYRDLDGRDAEAVHLLGWEKGRLAAYARIFSPQANGGQASIGRVATAVDFRGRGLGRELMERALHLCRERFPGTPVRIAAQVYLDAFYRSLGFKPVGSPYDEDGIAHIDMVLTD